MLFNTETANLSYIYLNNGLRDSKTVNGTTTYFLWDKDSNISADFGDSSTISSIYTRGANLIKNSSGTYYTFNGHGDVSQLTDSSGTVTKDYEYDAFGNETDVSEADTNPFRYCGQYYDAETGLIYLRARYCNPSTGSFITEDPAFDGVNWYSYCGGNPVLFYDFNGLKISFNTPEYRSSDKPIYRDSGDENDSRFTNLQAITDDTLHIDKETGEISYEACDNISRPIGTSLVRELINSDETTYIIFSYEKGKNTACIGSEDMITHEKSYVITIDPTVTHAYFTLDNSTGTIDNIPGENYIDLAHEMVHIVRWQQGIEPDKNIKNGSYSTTVEGYENLTYSPEELETVGITFFNNCTGQEIPNNRFYYTENAIRTENGLGIRIIY
ncbi:MAG: M91 family zinc metallopeptidase [Clostridiales bacterium]|nr:M91 family zinc metallopeptidase [Clostridiales bacterium]